MLRPAASHGSLLAVRSEEGGTKVVSRDLISQWMFKEDWDFVVRPSWAEFEAYAHACLARGTVA